MKPKTAWPFFSACWSRFRDQLCELPEVLGGCCELELFICAFGSSKSHHRHADVSLQMSEERLDFPPLNERGHVSIRFAERVCGKSADRGAGCRFRRLCPFWLGIALSADRMDCGAVVAIRDGLNLGAADFRANEAPYAFIAPIIAGIPMMFMTRVIL